MICQCGHEQKLHYQSLPVAPSEANGAVRLMKKLAEKALGAEIQEESA